MTGERRAGLLEAAAALTRTLAQDAARRAPTLDGRSGVLVAAGRWRDAALDAERALAAPDCPPERHLRLRLRVANCLRRLQQHPRAQHEFQVAQQMIIRFVFVCSK